MPNGPKVVSYNHRHFSKQKGGSETDRQRERKKSNGIECFVDAQPRVCPETNAAKRSLQ